MIPFKGGAQGQQHPSPPLEPHSCIEAVLLKVLSFIFSANFVVSNGQSQFSVAVFTLDWISSFADDIFCWLCSSCVTPCYW